jgi:hypothetical protein
MALLTMIRSRGFVGSAKSFVYGRVSCALPALLRNPATPAGVLQRAHSLASHSQKEALLPRGTLWRTDVLAKAQRRSSWPPWAGS